MDDHQVSLRRLTEPERQAPAQAGALNRKPVSAFVICFNEEDNIGECLDSLSFCDELLVIDSFSTDRTIELARERGARIIQRAWPGFRDQKQFGLESVTYDWVVNIDADERVSPELRENILRVLADEHQRDLEGKRGDATVGYYVNRVVFYLDRWWRSGGWYPEYRLRFFRKSSAHWGGIDPHEKPIVQGKTGRLSGEIYHFTYKNMDDQFARLHAYSSLSAKEDFRLGRKFSLWMLLVNPILRAFKFYVLKRGYREGVAGIIVAVAEGYYTFMKYAKLWEYQFNERSGENRP